jgi:ADP-heptose:LPS heptosyltransferase
MGFVSNFALRSSSLIRHSNFVLRISRTRPSDRELTFPAPSAKLRTVCSKNSMTHHTRALADRFVASPLEFLFNILARLLGATMHRDHTLTPENTRKIVVAKLVGMGSILQATPLLRSLKRLYPQSEITFVTLKSNRGLVELLEDVDHVICMDDSGLFPMAITTLRTIWELVRLKADVYFDLELYSAFASLMTLWAVTRNRVGFYRRSTRLKNGIYTHLVYFNTRMSVRQLYLQLGRVVGAPLPEDDRTGPIKLRGADEISLQAKLEKLPGWKKDQPYIVVNPNASDLLLERRWPMEYVVTAIERLTSEGFTLVLIGSRGEADYVTSILDRISTSARQNVFNTAGLLTLGELLSLLNSARCVLTNDTGPMHMAIALDRPTVCLFGPVSPEHYGHFGDNVIMLYAPVFCSPCVHEIDEPPCNGNNVCMQRLTPELVVDSVLRFVRPKPGRPGRFIRLPMITDDQHHRPLGLVVRASIDPQLVNSSARPATSNPPHETDASSTSPNVK